MLKKFLFISALAVCFSLTGQTTHTVTKGDTAYNIAKTYGISLKTLFKLNPSLENGIVKIGDVLVIDRKIKDEKTKKQSSSKNTDVLGEIVIQPKQTIYGLTKKYHISEKELRRLNPDLESKMKIGSVVIVPLDRIEKYGAQPPVSEKESEIAKIKPAAETVSPISNDKDYILHRVEKGETVFGIINHYGITMDELLLLNPAISEGLKAHSIIKIKKRDKIYVKKDHNAVHVVLMLPFGFNSNDSKMRTMSLDFLTGAKLAIEKNAGNGLKLNVKVIDAGNETSFKNSLVQINPENTDLIIGPFLKSNIEEVLDYVDSKKTPVVAPFADSEELYKHPNLIIASPNDNVYAERIAKEITQVYSNQKIYIVSGEDKENALLIKNEIIKQLKKTDIIVVNSAEDIKLDKNIMTGQKAPVIAVLASMETDDGQDFTNRIIDLSKEVEGIKVFSTSYHSFFEKKADELSQVNLVYLMDRKINTNGDFEKQILADFKNKYCKTPAKYSVIGFDIVNDILSRMHGKSNIFGQMGKVQTQLSTKFEYVRANGNGAYINNGYRVVRLN